MTFYKKIITIALCVIATAITRFLPFFVFSEKRAMPKYIKYLGNALPSAIFGMLVVYCLKDVKLLSSPYGLPEAIAIVATTLFHLWKRNMLVSIGIGTVLYMLLIQFVFI